MIEGLNPLHIVSIKSYPFKRRGWHPAFKRVRDNTPRWRDRMWLDWNKADRADDYGYISPAHVKIWGANRMVLKEIECKSNAEAATLAAKLNHDMDDFFAQIGFLQKMKGSL